MISLQELQQVIAESQGFGSIIPVSRNEYLSWLEKSADNRLIKAVIGFRRSGKSFLLKMLSKTLIDRGIPQSNIFYLNFENDLLKSIKTVRELRTVWEMYLREIADIQKPIFVIWDEIQLVNSWEKLVRTLYEMGKYTIFISGSNSNLLSGELSASLSGRCLTLEVYPFSFREYLDYSKVDAASYYFNKLAIDKAFSVYLLRGGIAEQFELKEPFIQNYRSGLVQKIILDDIIKRYAIDNVNVLQEVFEFISGNITSVMSLRKIVNRLSDQDLRVSANTIDHYIGYWKTSYALEKLHKFDYRLSRVFDRTSKYYVIDNLLIEGGVDADEKRLENLVYIELTRRYGQKNVFFGQDPNGYEVDFVVKIGEKFRFFQVCLELNDKNTKREFGNLALINKYMNGQATVLYRDDRRTKSDSQPCLPVVEWLLEPMPVTA